MHYRGLFGRIAVRAPHVPAYSWEVLGPDSGQSIAGGSATTPEEAINDLCGGLIRVFGTGKAAAHLPPDDAYRRLLNALEPWRWSPADAAAVNPARRPSAPPSRYASTSPHPAPRADVGAGAAVAQSRHHGAPLSPPPLLWSPVVAARAPR